LYIWSLWYVNILYVNKQEFSASSWRSNQGYTKMYGQPTVKVIKLIIEIFFLKCKIYWNVISIYNCDVIKSSEESRVFKCQ
jgi:hypothetical protein